MKMQFDQNNQTETEVMWFRCFWMATAIIACLLPTPATAQNVSGYGSMLNPHLFLIREPAVQTDLKLDETQQTKLNELNAKLDGRLLAIRNQADAAKNFDELTKESEKLSAEFLSEEQQERIRQINYRTHGWKSLMFPSIASRVGLTEEQLADVKQAAIEHVKASDDAQDAMKSGDKTKEQAEAAAAEALTAMQDRIKEVLMDEQKKTFVELVGPPFPLNELHQVAFTAPGFATGMKWINSPPLTLEKLKGKVVALHFFAFA